MTHFDTAICSFTYSTQRRAREICSDSEYVALNFFQTLENCLLAYLLACDCVFLSIDVWLYSLLHLPCFLLFCLPR